MGYLFLQETGEGGMQKVHFKLNKEIIHIEY